MVVCMCLWLFVCNMHHISSYAQWNDRVTSFDKTHKNHNFLYFCSFFRGLCLICSFSRFVVKMKCRDWLHIGIFFSINPMPCIKWKKRGIFYTISIFFFKMHCMRDMGIDYSNLLEKDFCFSHLNGCCCWCCERL